MADADPKVDTVPLAQLADIRRCEQRYHCSVKAIVSEVADDAGRQEKTWNLACIEDVSTRGLGLLLKNRMPRGTELAVVPLIPSWSPECKLKARIVGLRPTEAGRWIAGCRFTEPLTPDQLNVLLQNSRKT